MTTWELIWSAALIFLMGGVIGYGLCLLVRRRSQRGSMDGIAERMRQWQAVIRQRNNGADMPLADDCGTAASEIARLTRSLEAAKQR